MNLRCIAVSQDNYETLRNLGKTGMSFNDVISELIKKANSYSGDDAKQLRSEERPGNP